MAQTVQSRVSGIGYSVSQMQIMIFISCDEKCFSESFLSASKVLLLTERDRCAWLVTSFRHSKL